MSFVLLRLNVERWVAVSLGWVLDFSSGRTFKSGSISESALNTAYFVQRPGNFFEFG